MTTTPVKAPPAAHLHGIWHDGGGFHPLNSHCRGCRRCAVKAAEKPLLIGGRS